MSEKKALGQFFTTNYEYILQNMNVPDDVDTIIEPFVGNGDLLNFVKDRERYKIECYDIDPKNEATIRRDTLKDPPSYDGKFVLTNPPYLARNKNKDKTIYDLYGCNDLYKCFIKNLCESAECRGGIIIIPLNFICSIRLADAKMRRKFLQKFDIIVLNIFEERVFDDTSYSVCSLFFLPKTDKTMKTFIYPSKRCIELVLTEDNNYTIGGEIYTLTKSRKYKVERATKLSKVENITNILLKCIDDSADRKIKLRMVADDKRYIDNTANLSARSYATLVITPVIPLKMQRRLVESFNEFLEEKRTKYNSLFLTNYRESNTIARKRISFDLAFTICSHLIEQL